MTETKTQSSLITAYDNNTRHTLQQRTPTVSGWGDKIDRLFDLDHSFLPYVYSQQGVLFRAMANGLAAAIDHNQFGTYISDNPHAALEAELEVYFLSHELSDALTVARLWELENDAGLLCIHSETFNQRNQQKEAAVMAFSEPGFVFKYPFLTEPLQLENIHCIFVNSLTYHNIQRMFDGDQFARIRSILKVIHCDSAKDKRKMVEKNISYTLQKAKLEAATPINTRHFPTK